MRPPGEETYGGAGSREPRPHVPEPGQAHAPETGRGGGGDEDGGRPRGGGGPQGGSGGGVHVGNMSGGAIATGAYGQATSYSYAAPPPQTDEATLALLEAVRALRADIRVLTATDETAAVDGELGEIEGEITRTGRAGTGRLARLRDRLEAGASAVGLLASATAVVQAAAQVLG